MHAPDDLWVWRAVGNWPVPTDAEDVRTFGPTITAAGNGVDIGPIIPERAAAHRPYSDP